MIELRFHHDLYDVASLDEAVKVYGAYGALDVAREADESLVRVSVSADTAAPVIEGIDDRALAAELGNFVLGMTIEKARAAGAPAGTTEAAQ